MKVVGWNVQPVVVAVLDSGLELPVPVGQGQMIPAERWDEFKSGADAQALESLREQIEGPSGATPPSVEDTPTK